jgi:hypothetical protein
MKLYKEQLTTFNILGTKNAISSITDILLFDRQINLSRQDETGFTLVSAMDDDNAYKQYGT